MVDFSMQGSQVLVNHTLLPVGIVLRNDKKVAVFTLAITEWDVDIETYHRTRKKDILYKIINLF